MSCWTYVYGSFSGQVDENETEDTLQKTLGTVCTWGDAVNHKITQQQWQDAFDKEKNRIPMGSEGSVEYTISFKDSVFGKTAFINFVGYLRDYGESKKDIDYLREWFITIFNKLYQPFAYIKFRTIDKTISYEIYDHIYSFSKLNNNKIYRFIEHSALSSYRGFLESEGKISSRIVKITEKGKVRNAEKETKKRTISK